MRSGRRNHGSLPKMDTLTDENEKKIGAVETTDGE